MARTRAPIPAALAHTVFTSQEAYARAVTRDQLRGPNYQQLYRGIYAPTAHSPTSWDYARIVTHACPKAALSQISAALFWGFPLPTRFLAQENPLTMELARIHNAHAFIPEKLSGFPDFVYPYHHRSPPQPCAKWRQHLLASGDVIEVEPEQIRAGLSADAGSAGVGMPWHPSTASLWTEPLRIMSRERTFLDLATVLNPFELVAVGYYLVRRPRPNYEGRSEPFCTIACLEDARKRYPKIDGATNMRWALDNIRVGSDSPQETLCRLLLVEAGLPEPKLNIPILLPGGVVIPDRDLVYPAQKVVVEYQGSSHQEPQRAARDRYHAEVLRAEGWEVVPIVNDDLPYVGWCNEFPTKYRIDAPGMPRINRVKFKSSPYALAPEPHEWPLVIKVREAFRRQAMREVAGAKPEE